jgi:RNA polymerase sigma-70 factor (ECF subfamily)
MQIVRCNLQNAALALGADCLPVECSSRPGISTVTMPLSNLSDQSPPSHGAGRLLTAEDISKLLARVALRDRRAFDALYEHTSAKLFGVALRLLKDRAEAEDALQEIYIKIWQRAETYALSQASAISWLVAIARNHAVDRLRARRQNAELDEETMAIADDAPNPEVSAIAGSEHARVDECLQQLEPSRADAVRGAYLDGYSYQELADRFGIPLNTMRTWLRRSLIKLRECLEG